MEYRAGMEAPWRYRNIKMVCQYRAGMITSCIYGHFNRMVLSCRQGNNKKRCSQPCLYDYSVEKGKEYISVFV